jgi:hypothetical protein
MNVVSCFYHSYDMFEGIYEFSLFDLIVQIDRIHRHWPLSETIDSSNVESSQEIQIEMCRLFDRIIEMI